MDGYRDSKVWMTINSSFRPREPSHAPARHGTAHMEPVYKAGPLHAQTAGALHLKKPSLFLFFTPMFYSCFKDRRWDRSVKAPSALRPPQYEPRQSTHLRQNEGKQMILSGGRGGGALTLQRSARLTRHSPPHRWLSQQPHRIISHTPPSRSQQGQRPRRCGLKGGDPSSTD